MNLKIDKSGMLHVERNGTMIPMECHDRDSVMCSHHCPLFGEPEEVRYNGIGAFLKKTMLICQGRRLEGEITDERKEG